MSILPGPALMTCDKVFQPLISDAVSGLFLVVGEHGRWQGFEERKHWGMGRQLHIHLSQNTHNSAYIGNLEAKCIYVHT